MGSSGSTTFLMIKPNAVEDGHIGDIIGALEREGFTVAAIASRRLTDAEARRLYDVHEGREFFEPLVRFITSGMSVGLLLRGPDIAHLRDFIGATDPTEAREGSIRALYGRSLRENAVHASDSYERLEYESSFYFKDCPRTLTADVPGFGTGADQED
jgi:nucleoside-diphosphate kinase